MAYAQKQKPVYYYDLNGYEISKENYSIKANRFKPTDERLIPILLETDTCYISILKKRKNIGRLSKSQLTSLLKYLNYAEGKIVNQYSVILYHPGRDRCNDGRFRSNGHDNNIYDRKLPKRIKSVLNCNIFWIHKKDESLKFHRARYIDWQLDKEQFLEKLFFEYHYGCNSFVIINNSTGEYISLLGESGGNSLLEIAQEIKSIRTN